MHILRIFEREDKRNWRGKKFKKEDNIPGLRKIWCFTGNCSQSAGSKKWKAISITTHPSSLFNFKNKEKYERFLKEKSMDCLQGQRIRLDINSSITLTMGIK